MFILFMHSIHAFYSIHAMRPAILFIHSTAFHLFFTAFALLLLIYPYSLALLLLFHYPSYSPLHPSILFLIHPSYPILPSIPPILILSILSILSYPSLLSILSNINCLLLLLLSIHPEPFYYSTLGRQRQSPPLPSILILFLILLLSLSFLLILCFQSFTAILHDYPSLSFASILYGFLHGSFTARQ